MGRPKGSKNKKKAKPLIKTSRAQPEDDKPSFDLPAIGRMQSTLYYLRKEIERMAIESCENKKCIPESAILDAIKSLGLKAFIGDDDVV
jgi:hypothetical protein